MANKTSTETVILLERKCARMQRCLDNIEAISNKNSNVYVRHSQIRRELEALKQEERA